MITRGMNRRMTAGALLCAAFFLTACSDRSDAPTAPLAPSDPVAQLVAMSFSRHQVVDDGEYLVAEGDIRFRKADLATGPSATRLSLPGGPRGQYHATTLITQSVMAQGIQVDLSGISGNAGWVSAARSAMNAWNGTNGSTIKFLEVTTGGQVSFQFVSSISGGAAADAGYPVNGYPGGLVRISQAVSPTASQKISVMVHELGHIIGLRHTNWAAVGDSLLPTGAVWIPGTATGSESASVMTQGGLRNWAGFTTNDRSAANYMYPAPFPSLTGSYDGSGHPTFSWSAISNASQYRVTAQYLYYTWIYEPSFPEGGYWGQEWGANIVGVTSGTSLTDPDRVQTGDALCQLVYYVEALYPSGKVGQSSPGSQMFDAC